MNSGYIAKNIIRYLAMNWNNYSNESSFVRPYPPKCCYFVVVGGLACLADPRGYASWSFDSW